MSHVVEMVGKRFGRLLVLARADSTDGRAHWLCRCDCGNTSTPNGKQLRRGLANSCGCGVGESARKRFTTHNLSGTPEFFIWAAMIDRCTRPKNKDWEYYGGRGVTVCERWRKSFADFISDMKRRPSARHSIERMDTNGNYEPGNCKWATPDEQSRNRRKYFGITFNPVRNRNGTFRTPRPSRGDDGGCGRHDGA